MAPAERRHTHTVGAVFSRQFRRCKAGADRPISWRPSLEGQLSLPWFFSTQIGTANKAHAQCTKLRLNLLLFKNRWGYPQARPATTIILYDKFIFDVRFDSSQKLSIPISVIGNCTHRWIYPQPEGNPPRAAVPVMWMVGLD